VFNGIKIRISTAAAAFVLLTHFIAPTLARAATGSDCKELSHLGFGSRAKIVSALPIDASTSGDGISWLPTLYRDALRSTPPFCRIVVMSTPSALSRIGVEIWLPLSGWNGRFLGTGNGGYPLAVDYRALTEGLQKGFAVANTDLGLAAHVAELHAAPPGTDDVTALFVNHPVRMVDFGSRATHEMTLIAKEVTRHLYGKSAEWSYFAGCSTGGMQALREVEQYPEDYNGVVAGDPGQNRARVHLSILWNYVTVWQRPERVLSDELLRAMHAAVISACEGTSKSPYLKRPLNCTWRPERLLCGPLGGVCLTPDQVEAANLIYQGPRNPRTGELYYPGLARGSELGWSMYMKQADREPPFSGVFAFALGEAFRMETFDWDRDAETFIDTVGPYLDAMNTDLSAFRRRGGKLLLYHGGSDPLASAQDPVNFLANVRNRDEAGKHDPGTAGDYALLFVLPGMDHCRGGLGPDHFDQMSAIMRWTEGGVAPIPLTIWKQEANGAQSSRHLCPYVTEIKKGDSRRNSLTKECHDNSVD
jgi:feruloyl esterase